nr:immunoglobulin heavy chain junction region [Mus musculus]MBK4185323.1 immunoglobulin heavy chain junction region [Mus musculus]MBK4185324.1 immunoglobulin heavy chain junction region [Mus musculus]MBK4185325.1 immunoglobulin heavy chain junction region [Mus musculus]MBK4185326.1 immunoglobulin heavy chain junction region [Mus musculus]
CARDYGSSYSYSMDYW